MFAKALLDLVSGLLMLVGVVALASGVAVAWRD